MRRAHGPAEQAGDLRGPFICRLPCSLYEPSCQLQAQQSKQAEYGADTLPHLRGLNRST